MSTESELLTGGFWLTSVVRSVQVAAAAAIGLFTSNGIDTIDSVPWQGVASTAGFAALMALLAAVSGAKLRETVPAVNVATLLGRSKGERDAD